jgi:hypothetical protein
VTDGSFPPPPLKEKWFKTRFLKVPVWLWIFGGLVLGGLIDDATKDPKEQSSEQIDASPVETLKSTSDSSSPTTATSPTETTVVVTSVAPKISTSIASTTSTSSSVVYKQKIGVEYQNLTIDCSEIYLMGTVDVFNSGDVRISGRVEVPVETKESFMVPLSGVFLDIPAAETTKVTLSSTVGCREDQIVGEPLTVFTIPSKDNLAKLHIKDAFEWSDVRVTCDYESAWVRLEATVKNVSSFELTAGFEAYLQNGPLTEGEKKAGLRGSLYYGTAHKIQPGESRKIKFGYGDFCLKGKIDGPYIAEFETAFTY